MVPALQLEISSLKLANGSIKLDGCIFCSCFKFFLNSSFSDSLIMANKDDLKKKEHTSLEYHVTQKLEQKAPFQVDT